MSLRIWLPLTKDLKNQGLDDVTVTNNGVTFNANGKLGGCYSFGTGNSYITIDSTPLKTFTEFSFACWVKIISWNTSYSTIFAAKNNVGVSWYNLIFSLLRNSANSTLCFNISNGSNYTSTSCQTSTLSLNTWYHITCTYKSGQIKLYQDGNIVSIHNTNVVPNFSSIVNLWIGKSNESSYQSNNLLNDVRIYDHCLSPLEVKQISQGLILHYPLNNNGWGQENLLKDSKNQRNSKNTYIYWPFESEDISKISGNVCTISFDAKSTVNNVACDVYFRSNSGMVGSSIIVSNIMTNYKRFNITMVAPTSTFVSICIRNNGNVRGASTTATYSYKNIKVELGQKATPWCPNEADELYDKLGLNDNVEYDTSGFCNNGTRTGTFSWTGDTPRYNVSTVFNGTERIKRDTLDGEIYTLACWAKTTKNKSTSQQIIADSKSEMTISFYKGTIIGVFGTTRGRGSKSTLGSSYKENNWNHFVVVKTGTSGERAIYCNGVLLTPTSNDYWGAASGFFVGAKNDSQGNPFYGQICDVRAYATALSAEDILSLYNNSAYIDNEGNIYGAVYEEV